MTLADAKNLRPGTLLHYTGRQSCTRTVGPRGGVTTNVVTFKVTGQPKTWKNSADRVKVPVKFGLYEHAYLTEMNLSDFHLASDCPA